MLLILLIRLPLVPAIRTTLMLLEEQEVILPVFVVQVPDNTVMPLLLQLEGLNSFL